MIHIKFKYENKTTEIYGIFNSLVNYVADNSIEYNLDENYARNFINIYSKSDEVLDYIEHLTKGQDKHMKVFLIYDNKIWARFK